MMHDLELHKFFSFPRKRASKNSYQKIPPKKFSKEISKEFLPKFQKSSKKFPEKIQKSSRQFL